MTLAVKRRAGQIRRKRIRKHWQLYLLFLVPLASALIFSYGPMYGIVIAFKNYVVSDSIWGSQWVGLKHFREFMGSYNFPRLMKNTVGISLYGLLAGFPVPIIFALLINECPNVRFKKTVQMITYAPHFISTVVMVSLIVMFLNPRSGMLAKALTSLTGQRIDYMSAPRYFKTIYVWSGIWQSMGFSAVIYIAALAGVDASLHEAAVVDGASKLRKIWHVDLPSIMPTIVILFILSFGSVMSVGYEKIFLMQNQLNMSTSDVISTFVYRMGLQQAQYSFSAAVGLFNSVINAALLVIVNQIARRVGETSLW
ncbi:MAG: ABC transporter permease subunit [Oscillospiraceae bacterium]|jgi:putative aldouronate transport system permease protein|nr:ABC transporter permease subunit [Oscillospiraceae bacterium]